MGIAILLCATLLIVSCGGSGSSTPPVVPPPPTSTSIPAQGSATTLDIAEWNIAWFGDVGYGPSDETQQRQNVRDVIAGTDCDIWSLEEVVSASAFSQLVSALPSGYAGLLSSDASVTNGSAYYSNDEQKVALVYKTSVATVQSAQLILTANDSDFAGRPPMEVELSVTLNGSTNTIYVICFHAKAYSDTSSYQRRLSASTALKNYLDTVRPNDMVYILGDYNDDLDSSITYGQASPYQNFVTDTIRYFPVTKALSDARLGTTIGSSNPIDHHIVTNELAAKYVTNSVKAFRADQYITNYSASTTDHLPVITSWNVP